MTDETPKPFRVVRPEGGLTTGRSAPTDPLALRLQELDDRIAEIGATDTSAMTHAEQRHLHAMEMNLGEQRDMFRRTATAPSGGIHGGKPFNLRALVERAIAAHGPDRGMVSEQVLAQITEPRQMREALRVTLRAFVTNVMEDMGRDTTPPTPPKVPQNPSWKVRGYAEDWARRQADQ